MIPLILQWPPAKENSTPVPFILRSTPIHSPDRRTGHRRERPCARVMQRRNASNVSKVEIHQEERVRDIQRQHIHSSLWGILKVEAAVAEPRSGAGLYRIPECPGEIHQYEEKHPSRREQAPLHSFDCAIDTWNDKDRYARDNDRFHRYAPLRLRAHPHPDKAMYLAEQICHEDDNSNYGCHRESANDHIVSLCRIGKRPNGASHIDHRCIERNRDNVTIHDNFHCQPNQVNPNTRSRSSAANFDVSAIAPSADTSATNGDNHNRNPRWPNSVSSTTMSDRTRTWTHAPPRKPGRESIRSPPGTGRNTGSKPGTDCSGVTT